MQLHGSRKTIDDLTQQLASEGEKLQSQISSLMEENNMLNQMHQDAKSELQSLSAQLEEQINDHKTREISLNADVEQFKKGLREKPHMQAQISELQQLVSVETKYVEELKSLHLVFVEKETMLNSKLEEQTSILGEKDVLVEQVKELQNELKLAHSTLAEQKELVLGKEAETEVIVEKSLVDLDTERQRADRLEEQVEELNHKLQKAEAQYAVKDETDLNTLKLKLSQTVELEKKIIKLENDLKLANAKLVEQAKEGTVEGGSKDWVEVKSRDFNFGTSAPSKRKSKKRREGASDTAETTPANSTVTAEHSGPMAFKFILGVGSN